VKHFNTAGPCNPADHYMIPAAERLVDARRLIDQKGYFVVHAPRQTGKTTALMALAKELTHEGVYAALYFSCEVGQVAGDNYRAAQESILSSISRAAVVLPGDCRPPAWPDASDGTMLLAALTAWAEACPRPLVLVFDEIDALRGDSLMAVLRQLRSGFPERPDRFPSSVILCGLRDVRDYKAASGGDASRLGTASPFNVKVKSARLGDFTPEEVAQLYAQHTAETGQVFAPDAVERAFALTQGQPWLVNALAREVIEEIGVTPPTPITVAHIDEAKERLILARATHLDSLVSKLMEPRVRRVIGPLLAGEFANLDETYDDDVSYVQDLGLLAQGKPVRVANPIYREVIGRVLSGGVESQLTAEPRSFVRADGRLDMNKILTEFAAFWQQHGAILEGKLHYKEVAAQLVLLAYLQRVVNGGGYVEREYGVGRGRIDVAIRWPVDAARGTSAARVWQVEALELKAWKDGRPDPLADGLRQLEAYLEGLGLSHGYLVVFDRRTGRAALPADGAGALDGADATHSTSVVDAEPRAPTFFDATTPKGLTVRVMRG
jgi:hypothetical protein